jgi:hypothetical protein
MNNSFETQMDFIRERNRIKYENKLMKEEDLFSQKAQTEFSRQRQLELERKSHEEARRLEQLMIQEQLENERKELKLFIDNYIITRFNKNKGNLELNIATLRNEAENLFYDRLLKQQQDEEYNKSIIHDMKKIN